MDQKEKEINTAGAIDLKMLAAGKERFESLYVLSVDERNKLRQSDTYRLALMDLWECAASASGMSTTKDEFFRLLGQATYGIITEKIKIKE